MSDTEIARKLRRNATDTERLLWRHLRNRQLAGAKFRRQHPIGPYVVDFFCAEQKLVVELDGGQHGRQRAADETRERWLQSQGLRVLRFWNNEVLGNTEGVLEAIRRSLQA